MRSFNFAQRYLELTAVVTLLIGLVLLFWPDEILGWFIPGATGGFFVRFIGSALLGFAALNHVTARTKDREARKFAIAANLTTLSVATALSIAGVISGEVTNYQTLLIGEHLLFLAGFIAAYKTN